MLKRKVRQLLVLVCTALVMVALCKPVYSKDKEEKPKQNGKTSCMLIQEAKDKGVIDEDTAILYKFYTSNITIKKYKDMVPQEYISKDIIMRRHGDGEGVSKEIHEKWNDLKPETRKRIIELQWEENMSMGTKGIPEVKILSPKPEDIIYSNKVNVKGEILTPEIYRLNSAWIEGDGINHKIELSKEKYLDPEQLITNDTLKKDYLKKKEVFSNKKPGIEKLYGPPGKYLYEFNEQIELPGPGVYRVEVKASNQAGESIHEFNPYFYVIYPDKNNQDKTPPEVEMKLAYCNTWINESTGLMETKYEFIDDNVVIKNNIGLWQIVKDECKTVIFILYKGGDYRGTYTMQSSGNAGWGSLKDVSPGENKFKYIFIDAQGNKTTKELTVYRK